MLKWIMAHPCISHMIVSSLEALALVAIIHFSGLDAWMLRHPESIAVILGCVIPSAMYYGRESGQREHDLKHLIPPVTGFIAFLGAEFAFKWNLDNWKQWLSAAGATTVVGVVLYVLAVYVK